MLTFLNRLLVLIPASASVHYAYEYAEYEIENFTERTSYSRGRVTLGVSGCLSQLTQISAWAAFSGHNNLYLSSGGEYYAIITHSDGYEVHQYDGGTRNDIQNNSQTPQEINF